MQAMDRLSHLQGNFEHLLKTVGNRFSPGIYAGDASGVRLLSGMPHPFGNLAIARRRDLAGFTAVLEEMETWSRKAGVPVLVLLFPGDGLEACLSMAGTRDWKHIESMPGMWMTLDDQVGPGPSGPGVEIRLVRSGDDLDRACAVLSEGYPVPEKVADLYLRGIHEAGTAHGSNPANLLVTIDGEPAACASVCLQDGVAGVYCVATRERFRRRGLGSFVTLAALRHGRRLGAAHALLNATEQGESIYRRIGFAEVCRIAVLGFGE